MTGLGSNSPLIIMEDADMEKVIAATVATGYANAGQVCISTQRVLVEHRAYGDYLDGLKRAVEKLPTGDPLDESTKVGPMVREDEAVRVERWLGEAVGQGARLVTGGDRTGAFVRPAIVADVRPEMRIVQDELFGPAVAVRRFSDIDEAIALANDSRFGLAAGIFTRDLGRALRFIREVHAGNLHVNWGPQWRVDLMPYGGLKDRLRQGGTGPCGP